MFVSQKRIEANRRNAQRSTGPKTLEGKARSALNAVKHGLFAATPILSVSGHSENVADHNRLVSSLSKELQAETDLERYLVTRIVNLAWQLLRVERTATNPPKNRRKAFDRRLLEYTRRLIKRTERMYLLFRHVKRTQPETEMQALERSFSAKNAQCKTNPMLERIF